jgi:serine/threonine-protein kinase RsbW
MGEQSKVQINQKMKKIAQAKFSAEYNQLEPVRKFVERNAINLGILPDITYDLIWSIPEIVTNVIQHGYKEKPGIVEVILYQQGRDFIMQVRDDAPVFELKTILQPDLSLPLYERPFGGVGLYITNKLVDSLSHRLTKDGRNEITLVKRDII